MVVFHHCLLSFICVSLSTSVASTSFAALAIKSFPALWLIPVVFIITFSYHTLISILLVARSGTSKASRIYSTPSIICAYLLTSLWVAVFATSLTFTCLLLIKKMVATNNKIHIWMILLSALSFVEIIIMGIIAIGSHKELRKLQYKRKWEWSESGWSAQWRSAELPTYVRGILKTDKCSSDFAQLPPT